MAEGSSPTQGSPGDGGDSNDARASGAIKGGDTQEEDTDVALNINKGEQSSDFTVFLNNINVGFACAVDARTPVAC